MRLISFAIILIILAVSAILLKDRRTDIEPVDDSGTSSSNEIITYAGADANKLIRITSPKPGAIIKSPLTITGEAKGFWFFEGSFPIVLADWDGRIIATGHAQSQGEWMTEEFVPFTGTIAFTDPSTEERFSQRGSLILRKDNPAGLPENDASAEMTVWFR